MPAIVATPSEDKILTQKKTVGKKKSVDKWKKKTWFTIIAPKEFDKKELGTTIAEKPQSVVGRIIEVSARSLSGDVKKSNITLLFKVTEVKGNKAYAICVGHEIKDSYLRKFVRRRNTKVDVVTFVDTKDATKVKVKVMVLTANKIEQRKRTVIRKLMLKKIEEGAKALDSQPFLSELVFGNLVQKIFGDVKKVGMVKRVEVTKSRLFPQVAQK